jgi:hypothetical protein
MEKGEKKMKTMLSRKRRMTFDSDYFMKEKKLPGFEPILEEESSEHKVAKELICSIICRYQKTVKNISL